MNVPEYFVLNEQPFRIGPDPRYLFYSDQVKEVIAKREYMACGFQNSATGAVLALGGWFVRHVRKPLRSIGQQVPRIRPGPGPPPGAPDGPGPTYCSAISGEAG